MVMVKIAYTVTLTPDVLVDCFIFLAPDFLPPRFLHSLVLTASYVISCYLPS